MGASWADAAILLGALAYSLGVFWLALHYTRDKEDRNERPKR
jgi:hypothetical protein